MQENSSRYLALIITLRSAEIFYHILLSHYTSRPVPPISNVLKNNNFYQM